MLWVCLAASLARYLLLYDMYLMRITTMKKLKVRFLAGEYIPRRDLVRLHKVWKWEREGYIAEQSASGLMDTDGCALYHLIRK